MKNIVSVEGKRVMDEKKIVLCSLKGFTDLYAGIESGNKESTTKYRAIGKLAHPSPYNSKDKWLIVVEQEIDGEWFATGGGWYLKSLITDHYNDDFSTRLMDDDSHIMIDHGQTWGVIGIEKAIRALLLAIA
jgi:hypothetical protein